MTSMNSIVANAIATRNRVACNALTVEQQREMKDKIIPQMKAAKAKLEAKGEKIAKEINAYYAAIDKIYPEGERLQKEVEKLEQEMRITVDPFWKNKLIWEDNEAQKLAFSIGYKPDWAKKCHRGSMRMPDTITVP